MQQLNHPKIVDLNYKKGKEVSLRVYTIEQESRYLVAKNVPKLSLIQELKAWLINKTNELPTVEDPIISEAKYLEDTTGDLFTSDERALHFHL
jgi:hypothetical protein